MSEWCKHCGELWCDDDSLGHYIGHGQECPLYNVGVMEQRLRGVEHQAEQLRVQIARQLGLGCVPARRAD